MGEYKKILVAEDEDGHFELIRRAFDHLGGAFSLERAVCVREARLRRDSTQPDLVITDWRLPDGNGIELIERDATGAVLRPVVLMTSHGNEAWAVEALKLGALDYIVKSPQSLADIPRTAQRTLKEWSNIVERRRAEMQLRESEEKYRFFLESANDAVLIYSLTPDGLPGCFVEVNEHSCSLLGYSRSELARLSPLELTDAEHRGHVPEIMTMLKEAGRAVFATILRCKDGRRVPVEISARMLAVRNVPYVVALVRDITERQRLEDQLRQAQKMESLGRLAGGVAHDFNNMLGVILGYAELTLAGLGASSPHAAGLREIEKAAHRSSELTRQLLAFARRQTIAPRVLALNDTVAGMLKMLMRLIGEDVELVWKPHVGLWPVKVDPSQIDQILANLCVNARDAITGLGKIIIETNNVRLEEARGADQGDFVPGDFVLLSLADNGCGMEQALVDKIFEPFFTTKGAGTGLGLATVYGIVKQNAGVIRVESEVGRGTTFCVYLPRCLDPRAIDDTAPSGVVALGHGETVLLVEDELALLEVGKSMLESLNYRVLSALSPVEALRLVTSQPNEVRLMITDMVMPEMSGRELAERVHAVAPKVRCLFVSGYATEVVGERGILDSDVAFLHKPFSRAELAAKARQVLTAE